MSKELDIGKFEIIKTSSWGTGIVNGVSFKNSLRILDTEKGYILETQKLFGGRKLWLLKEGLEIGPLVSKSLLKPKRITLTSKEHSISLLGNLVNEIILPLRSDAVPAPVFAALKLQSNSFKESKWVY